MKKFKLKVPKYSFDHEYIERLEKALDEACKRLAYEDEITCMHLKQQYAWAKNKVPKTKEQIKEELMKDEED